MQFYSKPFKIGREDRNSAGAEHTTDGDPRLILRVTGYLPHPNRIALVNEIIEAFGQ